MSIPMVISLIISKLVAKFGGTALPGLIGLSINHSLINQIIKSNNLRSIIITGTNGKTTTAKLLSEVLDLTGIDYCRNQSGSNLLRGIATTLINQSNLLGKIKPKLAVWEVDEAVLPQAIKSLRPEIVVITNLSRDQLDRYGEVDHLIKLWQTSFDTLPQSSWLIVNVADPRLRPLKHHHLKYFGNRRSRLGLKYPPQFYGKFNYDNLWAVEAVTRRLKLNPDLVPLAARSAQPAFGRGERFNLNGQNYQINLVKNPASYKAVWQMILDRRHLNQPLMLLLNDLLADGTDISWIWDMPFDRIKKRHKPIVISGRRAADLALRLKYAGFNSGKLIVDPSISQAFSRFQSQAGLIKYILPTYTAMLELRRHLKKAPWN